MSTKMSLEEQKEQSRYLNLDAKLPRVRGEERYQVLRELIHLTKKQPGLQEIYIRAINN